MPKSSVVKARIEPELKIKGEAILKSLGLNTTVAITLFFTQLVSRQSFPVELKIPNDTTLASFEEAEVPEKLTAYEDVKEAFVGIWDSE